MGCKHENLKCTNNVFTCLDCGAVVPSPFEKAEPKPKKKREKATEKEKAE